MSIHPDSIHGFADHDLDEVRHKSQEEITQEKRNKRNREEAGFSTLSPQALINYDYLNPQKSPSGHLDRLVLGSETPRKEENLFSTHMRSIRPRRIETKVHEPKKIAVPDEIIKLLNPRNLNSDFGGGKIRRTRKTRSNKSKKTKKRRMRKIKRRN